MDIEAAQDIVSAQGGDFPSVARQLFGSVSLDFADDGIARHIRSTQVDDSRISELQAGAHTVHGDHVVARSGDPDCIKILIQTGGRSFLHQAGHRVEIGPTTAIAYDPVRPYSLVNPEPVHLHILQIPRKAWLSQFPALQRPLTMPMRRSGGTGTLLAYMSRILAGLSPVQVSDPLVLIGRLLPHSVLDDVGSLVTLRDRATRAIEAELHQPGLDISWLAHKLGCSPRYVQRAFAEVGLTPLDYLWRRRAERAFGELSAPADIRSISEIAFALGFSSSAHFSRVFRQHFECSPRDVRLSASPRPHETCR